MFQSLLFVLAVPLVLIVAGIAYQRRGLRRDFRRYPPPGRLIAVRTHSLHVHELGIGEPVVVFESGLVSSSLSWTLVQTPLAALTRTISYDRSGIGWSKEVRELRSVESMVADLNLLLEASGNHGPYVLVGHSFGGLLVRAFASSYPEKVSGIVLVDPVSLKFWAECRPAEQKRLDTGAALSRRGALLANVGVVRLALAGLASGKRWLPNLIAKASAAKAVGLMGRLTNVVQKLPPALQPIVQCHWSQAKSFRAMAAHLEILPASAKAVRAMNIPGRIPVTILSASDATLPELEERDNWAEQSDRGRHLRVPDSHHWIQLECPEEVLSAIAEMVEQLRS